VAVCNSNLTADLVIKMQKITQLRSFWFLSLSLCPVLLNWDMAAVASSSSSYNSAHNKLKYSPRLLTKLVHQIQCDLYQVCGKPIAWGKEKNFVEWNVKKSHIKELQNTK
jgi:hypothetical protein